MVQQIVWTESAVEDLREINEFLELSGDSKPRIIILINSIDTLKDFPKIGTKLPEFSDFDYYEITVGNHRVIFKLHEEKTIVIMALDHVMSF